LAHFPTDDTIALGSSRDLTITVNTLTGGTLTSLVLHDIAMPYDLFGVYVDNVAIRVRYISRKITCTIFLMILCIMRCLTLCLSG